MTLLIHILHKKVLRFESVRIIICDIEIEQITELIFIIRSIFFEKNNEEEGYADSEIVMKK